MLLAQRHKLAAVGLVHAGRAAGDQLHVLVAEAMLVTEIGCQALQQFVVQSYEAGVLEGVVVRLVHGLGAQPVAGGSE